MKGFHPVEHLPPEYFGDIYPSVGPHIIVNYEINNLFGNLFIEGA